MYLYQTLISCVPRLHINHFSGYWPIFFCQTPKFLFTSLLIKFFTVRSLLRSYDECLEKHVDTMHSILSIPFFNAIIKCLCSIDSSNDIESSK